MEAFFVASEVVLLTGSLVTPDGSGFDPLLFDKQGILHVAVFTDPSRVGIYSQQAEHQIRWRMLDVLRRVPGGYGVVINPGTQLGFEISPSGVGEILKDFARVDCHVEPSPCSAAVRAMPDQSSTARLYRRLPFERRP